MRFVGLNRRACHGPERIGFNADVDVFPDDLLYERGFRLGFGSVVCCLFIPMTDNLKESPSAQLYRNTSADSPSQSYTSQS